jgi:hypothetical protein
VGEFAPEMDVTIGVSTANKSKQTLNCVKLIMDVTL